MAGTRERKQEPDRRQDAHRVGVADRLEKKPSLIEIRRGSMREEEELETPAANDHDPHHKPGDESLSGVDRTSGSRQTGPYGDDVESCALQFGDGKRRGSGPEPGDAHPRCEPHQRAEQRPRRARERGRSRPQQRPERHGQARKGGRPQLCA